ncbi:MAG TPA: hypothetical protein GX401_03060 [Clostridiales bacterium]|nr:hypothetical protein [Clostridiales bacterium]
MIEKMSKYRYSQKDNNIENKKLKRIKFTVLIGVIAVAVVGVTTFSLGGLNSAVGESQNLSGSFLENARLTTPMVNTLRMASNAVANAQPATLELQQSQLHITKSESYTIELAEKPELETVEVQWSSSDSDIVVVDDSGTVTPIANGETTIVCTDVESGEKVDCVVKVELPVEPENIKLDWEEYTLTSKNEKLILQTTFSPDNATATAMTWLSSDEKVATVNEKGIVTAIDNGMAVITGKTTNGITAKCKIIVEPRVQATDVALDLEYINYDGNWDTSQVIIPTVSPAEATNKNVTWSSSDTSVAQVSANGQVIPIGNGTCKIICTTNDGSYKTASCDISVINANPVGNYVPGSNVCLTVNPVVANSVIEEAGRYVGLLPYVWGGTSLSTGADCSGFICAIYDRFGYNLWGLRTDLRYAGVEVPNISLAQAGDILVYSGHVAIYDGNGGRIHAPDEGCMVSHDYNIGGYYTIRRIIN